MVVTWPGNPPLTGDVSFYDGTAFLGSAPVVNGVATFNAGVLPAGSHSFSAVYEGGGTSSTSQGSTAVLTIGPRVTHVVRFGFHHQPTFLVVSFDGPLDPATAENVANYLLIGPKDRHGVPSYAVGIISAVYDPADHTVTLALAGRWNIHWQWTLTVKGTSGGVTGPSGRSSMDRHMAVRRASRPPAATIPRRSR